MGKKYFSILFLCLIICVTLFCGCERKPLTVSFQDATMAGSDQNTINVHFSDDKKFDKKVVDIWIKADVENLSLTVNKSNQPTFKITLSQSDMWYSMTTLELESYGKVAQEDFCLYKDVVDNVYVMQTEQKCQISLKAVTGDKVKNAEETGYLLANAEDVSKIYNQKLTALKK